MLAISYKRIRHFGEPQVRVYASAGMELNYHRVGSGEPLLLMHGIGMRWQYWEPQLPRLAAERDVIAVDLPGFGDSPMPPPGTPAGPRSLTRLMAEFIGSLGLDRPHVAGNSLGGWISLELAKQGLVRSATALSPAGFHNNWERFFQRASLQLAARSSRLLAPRADRVMRASAGRALFAQYFAKPTRVPPDAMAASVRSAAAAPWFDATIRAITTPEVFSGGEQITVPVTIAWAERDHLLLPRQARRAQALIPSARVITLRGCGHIPMYDDPDLVASVLLEGSAQPAAAGR
jgi:pimeloyl-ACP methyl ester carboxylesterase